MKLKCTVHCQLCFYCTINQSMISLGSTKFQDYKAIPWQQCLSDQGHHWRLSSCSRGYAADSQTGTKWCSSCNWLSQTRLLTVTRIENCWAPRLGTQCAVHWQASQATANDWKIFSHRNSIFFHKMHSHFFTLFPDTAILFPAFYVRKASESSVDLGQLKCTGSDGRR